ncbi:MAG TPA: hypothetical protein VFQ25_07710 [Ktedonobacterales bacterium]|nr:hypothetical protein [Ktedonobacterales bacterium]
MKLDHSPDSAPTTHAADQARLDDIAIAQAIARAARTVPGVSDISPGRFALVATYGVHERVPGVVLWRAEDGAMCVEAHVRLDARVVMPTSPAPSAVAASSLGPEAPDEVTLLLLADQIRLAIHRALHALGLPRPARIDVAMDDMV